MSNETLTSQIKQRARDLGFELTGVCAAAASPGFERFQQWIEAGYAGQMSYLADRAEAYRSPAGVLAGAQSVVMLGMNYFTGEAREAAVGQGRISRYAWGEADYHDVIHARLKQMCQFVRRREPGASVRGVVDTAPLLEREFAQLAGLGWIGKNTLLINPQRGSWFFLAALLTDLVLEYDAPHEVDHCGTCRACLDACPTDAFVAPYVLDATRCISYLTIELREAIPRELRPQMGDWLYGCDVCQDVCPWNRFATPSEEAAFAPQEDLTPVDARALFQLDDAKFRRRFRRTPMWRAKRRGLLRNAAIVLGNRPHDDSLAALKRGLADQEPLVRGACAWALGRFDRATAREFLKLRQPEERDETVLAEIESALSACDARNSSADGAGLETD
ncbi:MAG: tRNA epoxyqueuosine(34) reductase QueG [Pirellulaceae bacterium]